CTDPPDAGVFLSFPLARKPTDWSSGDQNGSVPFSVPASSCAVNAFSERIQRPLLPSTDCPENTSRVPSGDNAYPEVATPPANDVFSGGKMLEQAGTGFDTARVFARRKKGASARVVIVRTALCHGFGRLWMVASPKLSLYSSQSDIPKSSLSGKRGTGNFDAAGSMTSTTGC